MVTGQSLDSPKQITDNSVFDDNIVNFQTVYKVPTSARFWIKVTIKTRGAQYIGIVLNKLTKSTFSHQDGVLSVNTYVGDEEGFKNYEKQLIVKKDFPEDAYLTIFTEDTDVLRQTTVV